MTDKNIDLKNISNPQQDSEAATGKALASLFLNERVKQSKKTLTPREVILSLCRAKNWKQVDLANEIGMSRQGFNNYLRGHWIFPTSIKIKIAEALEVDSAVIWDLEKK